MANAKLCVCVLACVGAFNTLTFGAHAANVDLKARTVSVLAPDAQIFGRIEALADSMNHEDGLRVLPIQGAGCMQAAADVLRLEQVDMALLAADCVAYAELQELLPNALKQLAYVARVDVLPIVIITRKDIPNLTALAGLRIATGPAQSAPFASGELLLGALGLPFKRVAKSDVDALVALQSGEADAALLVGLGSLDGQLDPTRYHALGLSVPSQYAESYAPALLDATQLRGLASTGGLETVSTSLALVVKRKAQSAAQAERIKIFTKVFFTQQNAQGLIGTTSVNIAGWQRHDVSTEALEALGPDFSPTTETFQQGDGP